MSFNSSDDDSQQRFALGFLIALIALLISVVVGTVVVKQLGGSAQSQPAATAVAGTAPAAAGADPKAVAAERASVRGENGGEKGYFSKGEGGPGAGANEALADVVKGVADGKMAVVSGFHDATGDAALNAELAKQRALAVRDALKGLGVAEDKIELKKPEETTATGSNAEARRVEVVLGGM